MDDYEFCPRCGCRDIVKVAEHSTWSSFRCEDCGFEFDIDEAYLNYDYDASGHKDCDEEDY